MIPRRKKKGFNGLLGEKVETDFFLFQLMMQLKTRREADTVRRIMKNTTMNNLLHQSLKKSLRRPLVMVDFGRSLRTLSK